MDVTLREYLELRADLTDRIQDERDRRYAEVNTEREKALKIKEQADRDALELARLSQVYKDEKANELREQINRERVLYATKEDMEALSQKIEATLDPIIRYIAARQGQTQGGIDMRSLIIAVVGILIAVIGIATRFVN